MRIEELISNKTKEKIYKSTNKNKGKSKVKNQKKKEEKFTERDIKELMGQHYYRRGPNGSIRQVK